MEIVKKSLPAYGLKTADRELAILIYNFLQQERYESGVPKRIKEHLHRATDCLERVYKIRFTDYAFLKDRHSLPDIFLTGFIPIKVMDRLKAEEHRKKGNAFMADNKSFKSAEIEYSRAIHLNPRNAVYWCNRAASRIRLESYFSAISDCERALELDRSYTKALVWQGIAYALTDRPGKAIRCYRKALRIEPGNEVCLANLDVINRKFNRTSFRILDPLCRYGRHLARLVVAAAKGRQDFFQWSRSERNSQEEYQKRQEYLRKFSHGPLD